MNDLTRKKISRTQLRNHCKRLEGQLNDVLDNFPEDGVKKLRALKANYESQVGKIATASSDIAGLITVEADLAADMEAALLEEDLHYEVLAKIDENLQERLKPDVKPTVPTGAAGGSGSVGEYVKTPKIDLKSFDGNILNWQSWWDQYEAAVHNQPKMAAVNKFCYLKRLLCSSAEECISGLSLTNENYPKAIELLKERYGNKQILINAYIQKFENLRVVKSMNKVKELRFLYDSVVSTIRNLEILEVDADKYGSFLVPLLSTRLPEELKMVMSREFKNAVWEITEMMRIFKDELEAKERCTMPSSNNDDDPSDDGYSTLNLHTQQRRGKGGQNRGAPKKRSCGFCGKEDHSASQCSNVTDLNARV